MKVPPSQTLSTRHTTDHSKTDRQIFAKVSAGLDLAIGHAGRLTTDLAAVDAESCGTGMPGLIEALDALRRRRCGAGRKGMSFLSIKTVRRGQLDVGDGKCGKKFQ